MDIVKSYKTNVFVILLFKLCEHFEGRSQKKHVFTLHLMREYD